MTDERVGLLDEINFVWDSHSAAWEDHYLELKAFKALHNHCNVTTPNNPDRSTLVSWIKNQRRQYRQMKEGRKTNLTENRIRRLECLGFQLS
mmetsp:Transcript_9316/g.22091  ORF Transcript_9316/g.22091 Transcript_9316/m.22091 type:complete len:92 (-) Transcript_9316:54-329(-)